MNASTKAHYQAMAEQLLADNRKPLAPLLLSGFEHRGCTFDIFGTFDEDGATISGNRRTRRAARCSV